MKNALLALALFAFVGTASAHEGEKDAKGKKAKKECSAEMKSHCAKGTAGTPACCMKKDAKATTTAATPAPAAAPVEKSL